MAYHQDPETFVERRDAALHVIGDMCKWPMNGDGDGGVHDFHDRMRFHERQGRIPERVGSVKYGDEEKTYDTYTWQIFATAIPKLATLSREEVIDYRNEQRSLDNPVTATDGSKGQWEAARSARVLAAEWLLGEE